MTHTTVRVGSRMLALGAAALALSGCMGPTYGTGTSQGQQLFNDLDGMLTLGSSNRTRVDYSPRPELVKSQKRDVLPPPRVASASSMDANWPESPEQRRARLRAAAPDGSDGALPVAFMTADKEGMTREEATVSSTVGKRAEMEGSWISSKQMAGQRVAANERARVGRQGDPSQRRYLSEPPLTYRQPAATAPAGDPGVDEDAKQRNANGTKTLGSKLKSLWPF
ncbi:hypothetical protein [Aureimonas sp. Leaf324]|jgi:hypothetical protein|uniref:hypothetical protein n=1 Tax=Aureimonas sp. Leaf324 TaxID=1736336 RepID=UPI0006FBC452|nr:hypothetical protein [Aureimonas sp. Leaf324]KQQ81228.1 hypothetical protein ASF65_09490 [Aureimonas sp. Leaf324]